METLLRIGFFVVALSMMVVRVSLARRAKVMEPGARDVGEGAWVLPLRALFLPVWGGTLGLYLFRPELLAPVTLTVPLALRWAGCSRGCRSRVALKWPPTLARSTPAPLARWKARSRGPILPR